MVPTEGVPTQLMEHQPWLWQLMLSSSSGAPSYCQLGAAINQCSWNKRPIALRGSDSLFSDTRGRPQADSTVLHLPGW